MRRAEVPHLPLTFGGPGTEHPQRYSVCNLLQVANRDGKKSLTFLCTYRLCNSSNRLQKTQTYNCPDLQGAWVPCRGEQLHRATGMPRYDVQWGFIFSKHGNAAAKAALLPVGWMKDISCQAWRAVWGLLSSLALGSLLPPALAVMAVPNPLRCFVLGLLISFSSIRMLLRQSIRLFFTAETKPCQSA